MLLGLDFDHTYTVDPTFWNRFISMAVAAGHRVYCVTARTDRPANRRLLADNFGRYLPMLAGVLYCDHQPKRAMAEAAGLRIHIWIDDVPETVGAKDEAEMAEIEERFNIRETPAPVKTS